jgi:signal transduction histidine kinase
LPLSAKQQEILILTEKFLEQLDRNEIPLTDGTKTILDELDRWFSILKIQEEQRNKMRILQESIYSKLDFVSGNGGKIRKIAMSDSQSELPSILANYSVYAINSSDQPELLVLDKKLEQQAGFIISLKCIWDSIANHLPVEKELEYTVAIVSGSTSPANKDKLVTRAELSPYFPMHRMIIKPANEKLVEKYVRKRSWTYSIALVLMLGGMSLGIVLILRDIKREKEMTEMQSEFVAHVTHELKTPLTSINMFAETIFLDRAKSEELRKKYSNIIIKESEVLKRKIDNILEYSVRKNESTKYRMKETNLTSLVGEVMDEMKYWLDINKFEVHTEFEADIFAHIDLEAIKQALTNLIGNAIKYSPVEKRLRVSLKKQAKQIFIEVEDSGMGIPKDQIDLIFEKFYRVRSIDSETTGTGLGLSVTRDIVKAHHGEIRVVSEINKGSKFTIILNS